ncbi:MAG: site-specific integrase [Anaerolineae bacterium]
MTPTELVTRPADNLAVTMTAAGLAADLAAGRAALADHLGRRAPNTRRRMADDLAVFADYLVDATIPTAPRVADLAAAIAVWPGGTAPDLGALAGVTWGMVAAFVQWQLKRGYAIGSVNVRLSTVKTLCKLAAQADVIAAGDLGMIRSVSGYRLTEGRNLDKTREVTRLGAKKVAAVSLDRVQAGNLKAQPVTTPQGRRDRVLITLLLDHGLRVGELVGLTVNAVDLAAGVIRFYRPKVNKTQTHRLTADARAALAAYVAAGDIPAMGPLLRASTRGGKLAAAGMTERAVTARVETLGAALGIEGLSAHDLRHFWATTAAANKTDPFSLQEAGGWSSLAMPRRYVEDAKIANEGVRL